MSWRLGVCEHTPWLLLYPCQGPGLWDPIAFIDILYAGRMQTSRDKAAVVALYSRFFADAKGIQPFRTRAAFSVTEDHLYVGHASIPRVGLRGSTGLYQGLDVLPDLLQPMESLVDSIGMGWMTILAGPSCAGKTSLARLVDTRSYSEILGYAER